MKASIIGRIRNTNLPRAKALLPLFEAVVNSFHTIEEVPDHPNPLIRIEATGNAFSTRTNWTISRASL